MIEEQKKSSVNDHQAKYGIIFPIIGHIAYSGNSGNVMVDIKGGDPKSARLVSGLDRTELTKSENIGREVLVVFEKGDPDLPIIVALMENPIEDILSVKLEEDAGKQFNNVLVDGKVLTIEANDKIVLKCGKGSITLNKHGKITIKGTHVISRSSGSNKIKGASVNIN